MRSFDEFIKEGIVIRISPDEHRAENLISESERKYKLMKKTIRALGIDDENANEYVESCYNIIMFLVRAQMFKQGYKSSGQSAHESEVAFTTKLGLTDSDIHFLDRLRYFRNGILYYGKRFDKEYAEKVISFTDKKFETLRYS